MRTLQEIQNEYSVLCAQLGDFEHKVVKTKKQILDRLLELEAEQTKVKEVQAEVEKAKAAEAPAAAPEATPEAAPAS